MHATWTGHVDLDQPATDHVQAGECDAVPEQGRAERGHDRPVGMVDLRGRDRRSDPEVVGARPAEYRADDLRVEQEQSFVAVLNGREVLLSDHLPATATGG